MIGLVIAGMIGAVGVAPASADNDHNGKGRHDNGRYEKKGHGHGRSVQHTTVYQERVYVPPPVIYVPPPPPGISIFLPPLFSHM